MISLIKIILSQCLKTGPKIHSCDNILTDHMCYQGSKKLHKWSALVTVPTIPERVEKN